MAIKSPSTESFRGRPEGKSPDFLSAPIWDYSKMLTTSYRLKVKFLKTPLGNRVWRRWRAFRGETVGSYGKLPQIIRKYAPGRSFVDIGCMWGVNGEYAFVAEEAGATTVKGVDVFGPTPEFEQRHAHGSGVEFILGDAVDPRIVAAVGPTDVVFCAGVLYHHPSPFDLLVALRLMCNERLILRTSTIPEIDGLENGAVYWPLMSAAARELWQLSSLGVGRQVGISGAFESQEGYGNWFWGLTPSCLISLLHTAGFEVEHQATEPFAQTMVCRPVAQPFQYALPSHGEARRIGEAVSVSGIAKPA